MFSAIILNQQTMESFNQFYPLFQEAIINNNIGLCRWIESGTTVETAVPELSAMVNDKPKWRAIIVRMYDESTMLNYQSCAVNPFDFEINNKPQTTYIGKSEVPFIHLTQLIGGVPSPAVKFADKVVDEQGRLPQVVYEPIKNDSELELYAQLTEKYHFHGKHPSEIVLISIRKKAFKPKDDAISIWQLNNEIKSSEFWKLNSYPSTCRFMVYEMDQQGPVIENADIFKFWSSVMLISLNKIDPSSFQAYRLYRFNLFIKDEELKTYLHDTYRRLQGALEYLNNSIKLESGADTSRPLPEYHIEVPVRLKNRAHRDKEGVRPKAFGLVADRGEQLKWSKMKKREDDKTKAEIRIAEESLDKAADGVIDFLSYPAPITIDKFQLRDVTAHLDEVYNNILHIQSELPKDSLAHDDDLKQIDALIQERIRTKTTRKQSLAAYGIIAVLSLLVIIATVYFYVMHEMGSVRGIVILILLCLGIPLIIQLLVLLYYRTKLRGAVRQYKDKHTSLLEKLQNNISLYSDYMSSIATHARGSSFLRSVQKQKKYSESEFTAKQQHIKDINFFISHIENWCRAFYCIPQIEEPHERKSSIYVDTEIPSKLNRFYTFDYGMNYLVPLNDTGEVLDAPVNFIEKLTLEREELYDDNRSFI